MNFVVVDAVTGAIIRGGDAPSADVPLQAGPGERVIGLADGVMRFDGSPLDLVRQAAHFHARIDAEAEAIRLQFITPGSGQALTYLRKLDAARGYLAGDTLTDPQLARITNEAARLGVSNAEAAASLIIIGNSWDALDAALDNTRLVAKQAVSEAGDIVAQDDAATVDWNAVLAP